jgi:pilus assembly protein Flp/PilA
MLKLYVALQTHMTGLLNRDDRGATAVEYGLLVALIALVIVAVLVTLGPDLAKVFTHADNAVTGTPAAP